MSTRSSLATVVAFLLVASTLPAATAPAVATAGEPTATDTTVEPSTNATAQSAEIIVWTAPKADFADLDDRAAVLTAIRDGSLTRTDAVAEDDVVVFAVPASGAFGALDYGQGPDEPEADALVDLVAGDDFRFHLNQTDPAPNRARATLDLAATNENDGLRVVPDERNGTLFVAMRTDRLSIERGQRDGLRVDAGDRYEANFTIAESAGLSDGRRTALGSVTFVERSARFDTGAGGSLRLATNACNPVLGSASVAPGSELSLRFRGDDAPLSLSRSVTVGPEGRFHTAVPVTNVSMNTSVTATVSGFPDSETAGTVDESGTGTARVAFPDQSVTRGTVTVESLALGTGGFVVLYPSAAVDTASGNRTCPPVPDRGPPADARLGVSGYLPAGEHEGVTIGLDEPPAEPARIVAAVYFDLDADETFDPGAGDHPALANAAVVSDSATVSLATTDTPTTTTPPTTDPQPTSMTPTTSPTPHPPDPPESETPTPTVSTTADGPGFGPLAALLALVALVALAAARRL